MKNFKGIKLPNAIFENLYARAFSYFNDQISIKKIELPIYCSIQTENQIDFELLVAEGNCSKEITIDQFYTIILPLETSRHSFFIIDDETVKMAVGIMYACNTKHQHTLFNAGIDNSCFLRWRISGIEFDSIFKDKELIQHF